MLCHSRTITANHPKDFFVLKRIITKSDIRSEIEQQMADYLDQGGAVNEIERGLSGRAQADGPLKADNAVFQQPKTGRTYVPEVTAAIDARRKPATPIKKPSNRKPRKKMIYDDFGEPLRWEWEE